MEYKKEDVKNQMHLVLKVGFTCRYKHGILLVHLAIWRPHFGESLYVGQLNFWKQQLFSCVFLEYSHFSITDPLKLCSNKIKICRGSQHVADNEDNNNLSLLNIWPTKTTQSMKKSKFLEE